MLKYVGKYFRKDLFQVIFHVTGRCNSRCAFCFAWKNLNKNIKDLSLEEIRLISKNMPDFPWLMLSGGEPFLRKDIDEIVKIFYVNNGVRHITIPTNCLLPSIIEKKTEKILDSCKDATLNMALSLDGLEKEHDKLRGVKGNFKKVIKTFDLLKRLKRRYPNLSVKIHTVITNKNYDKLDDLIEYVKKIGPDMHTFDFVRGSPRDKTVKLPSRAEIKKLIRKIKDVYKYYPGFGNLKSHSQLLLGLSKNIMNTYFDLFLKTIEQKRQVIPCYAHRINRVIMPNGDVSYCEMLNPVGNLREFDYNMKRLEETQMAKKTRERIINKKCFCYHPCYQYTNILFNPICLIKSA